MAHLHWLHQLQPHHRALVGNKAFYLSQLLQKGFPVVPGFVVSSRMMRQFLETIDWSEPLFADLPHSSLRLDLENSRQLQAIAQQLRDAIEMPALPGDWLIELDAATQQLQAPVLILRPSLLVKAATKTAAKAVAIVDGKSSALFDMQICLATGTDVAEGLKRLWAQLFRARSLFYWQHLGIHLQQVKLAVLVQPLRSPIASGTVQILDHAFEVQATPGLGMALTWGEVLPDVYQVHAPSGVVQTQQLGNRAIVYLVATTVTKEHNTAAASSAPLPQPYDGSMPSALPPALSHSLPVSTPLSQSVPGFPLLQAYLPAKTQQLRYALDDHQLSALIQLGHRLRDGENVFAFEWILYAEQDAQSQIYLTQVMPPQTLPQPLPTGVTVRADGSHTISPHTTSPHTTSPELTRTQPTATIVMRSSLPQAPLLVTGLGAARGRAIARAKVITQLHESIETIPPGTVLVAGMLPPHWLPLIQQAAGIVMEQGSMTSHSAIIAREVGVPAVVAATNATQQIRTGELVMVDGDRGRVYRIADALDHVDAFDQAERLTATARPEINTPLTHDRPALNTQLLISLSQPESLEAIAALPIDGIGLLRGELLAISLLDYQHPLQWLRNGREAELIERLTAGIRQFAAALAPRPVFYRSLDLRSHESRGLPGGETVPLEINPTLGLHGTFSYCLDPTLFDLELVALAQVQASHANIHLILPFVRTVEEFQFCRQRVQNAGLTSNPQFQLWIMAEVPSVLFLLQDYVRAGVQGIAIGTNDLTQLLLGADRDHGSLATAFDARHPSVKAAIAHLIQQAKQLNIPCSLCGQAPSHDPKLVEASVYAGITSIVVEREAVEATYEAIARAEQRLLLETTDQ